jgi:hypothetical protein
MPASSHKDCYLCGKALSEPTNRDHVPPRRFFAPEVRKKFSVTSLITLPTHQACNARRRLDEEYFVHTLLPFARGSTSGDALFRDGMARVGRGENVKLANQVLKEFEHVVGGIILPANRVAKRIDPNRVEGVIYKIVRGLHYHHLGEILPSIWDCSFTITPPGEPPPEIYQAITDANLLNSRGSYQGVFAYSFHTFPDVHDLHVWLMLLWDRIIITATFHDPACECDQCSFVGPQLPEVLPSNRFSH